MKKKDTSNPLSGRDIERLLNAQTLTILSAIDEKTSRTDKKIDLVDFRVAQIEQKLEKMEMRINQKFDRLTTTLDKFLKRLTDIEDEFEMMKLDLNRMKRVIKEKLGVDLT